MLHVYLILYNIVSMSWLFSDNKCVDHLHSPVPPLICRLMDKPHKEIPTPDEDQKDMRRTIDMSIDFLAELPVKQVIGKLRLNHFKTWLNPNFFSTISMSQLDNLVTMERHYTSITLHWWAYS